jgi:thiamine-phosphate diphosphorylase
VSPIDPTVYLVTDTVMCGGAAGVVQTVREAVAGGVTAVQVRDPFATTRELAALARAVLEVLRGTDVPLVVNDRVDVALAVGAAGVHVGQRDLHPLDARRLIGPRLHVGLSISNADELTEALSLPAGTVDLLGVGPVRTTPSKTDAAPALGFDGLAELCRGSSIPCVAIGGLGPADTAELRESGAAGVAVISAICGRPDPAAASKELLERWRTA